MIKLREIKQDKLLHFIGNAGISVLAASALSFFLNPFISIGVGMVLSFLVAWFKEYIYDKKMGKGVFNLEDLKFGTYGAVTGSIGLLLFYLAILA